MKKTKIVLFTLLLSIMGAIGSTNAASVNNSSRSADLMPSAVSQSIQNSSLSKTNIENSESGKCILWSPGFRTFKKGDRVKVLLPHGNYTGTTRTVKVVSNGKQIGILYLTYGYDYGIIVFTVDTNSGEIAQFIADFDNIDFGAIGSGGVINIGGGITTGGTAGVGPVAPIASSSSHISVESQSHSSEELIPSKNSYYGNGKGIVIHYSSGVIIKPASYSSHGSSSSIKSLSSSSSMSNGVHRHSRMSSMSYSSISRSTTCSSSSRSSSLSVSSSRSSKTMLKRHRSHKSIVVIAPESVKESSKSLRLSHPSSTLKVPLKTGRHSHLKTDRVKALSRMVKPEKKQRAVRPVVDRKGNVHLNSQQIRTLKHEFHFPNSTAVTTAKKLVKAMSIQKTHPVSQTIQRNKLTLKNQKGASLVSSIRRVILPIKGILPATRMDPHTWVYSLIGLAIIITSGKALFFSKKQKK